MQHHGTIQAQDLMIEIDGQMILKCTQDIIMYGYQEM